jgi:hypothetical protein
MPNQEVNRDRKPEDHEEVGRVHNEPEKRADQGPAPLQEEIGVVKNEEPGTGTPSEPEIGRTKNETPGTGKPSEPEIGTTKNEPSDRK